jgi:hypothetical protein
VGHWFAGGEGAAGHNFIAFCLLIHLAAPIHQKFGPWCVPLPCRVEDLIARDYLERDKENPQLFRYLA